MSQYNFKNLSIFKKIFFLSALLIITFLSLLYFQLFPSIENKLYGQKEYQIKTNVEIAYGILSAYSSRVNSGEISLEEAQKSAKDEIKKIRYNDGELENYFWINDLNTVMIMHPIKPEMEGKSQYETADKNGKYFFREMVSVCKQKGEGMIEYSWDKPGHDKPQLKFSYVKLLKDWGWIVGSGVYVEDVGINEVMDFVFIMLICDIIFFM